MVPNHHRELVTNRDVFFLRTFTATKSSFGRDCDVEAGWVEGIISIRTGPGCEVQCVSLGYMRFHSQSGPVGRSERKRLWVLKKEPKQ